jgi:hypothetical protein
MPPLVLTGTEVFQGNAKGRTLSANVADTVLYTYDMGPCVAVCGYNGQVAFMIHSDTTGGGGIGHTDLLTGIQNLVNGIGNGAGFTITLNGGSVAGVATYLGEKLPNAAIVPGEASDGSYITWNGAVATTKAKLAKALGVESVSIQ